ncbi:MAG TPA: SpoIIE family protein phosphatase [Thermoanaerobaculia bacterium]
MLPGHSLKPLAVAIGIGVLFAGVYALSRPAGHLRIIGAGALTGLAIWAWATLFQQFFRRTLHRRTAATRTLLQALLFLVAGICGWITGMVLARPLFGAGWRLREILDRESALLMLVTSGIAVGVGLAFYVYELLRTRLEQTLAQLKEAEWAEKELELARAIQTRLLPPALVEGDGYTIAARNLPARFVAGDFYDVVRLDDGSLVIVVADVAGKGVGASLIMASVKAVLPFVAREHAARAMSMLNEKLVQELGRREFVALAYARFFPNDGSLELLNAGFPDPYVIGKDGVRALTATGTRLPLGVRRDAAYEPLAAHIAPGERLLFVSDGIPEAPIAGEPLGYDGLVEILTTLDGAARGEAWLERFLDAVRARVDDGLADDWTAVVVERASL